MSTTTPFRPSPWALLGLLPLTSCGLFEREQSSVQTAWEPNKTTYFHQGAVGAGPALTTSAAGTLAEERRYEPFGQPIDANVAGVIGPVDFRRDPQNSLGKLTDPNTGWSYHGARWMQPQTARWTSPDPAVKGPSADAMRAPWDLNPYAYVAQAPTTQWDPDGARPEDMKNFRRQFGEDLWIKDPDWVPITRRRPPDANFEFRSPDGAVRTTTAPGSNVRGGKDPAIQTQLERRGAGFVRNSDETAWGRKETIDAIRAAGKMFDKATEGKYVLLIGGIGYKGGGAFGPHKGHDVGLDLDVYVVKVGVGRVDHMAVDVETRQALQAAVNAFRDSGGQRVERIYFNNWSIDRVTPDKAVNGKEVHDHDTHLHVSFVPTN